MRTRPAIGMLLALLLIAGSAYAQTAPQVLDRFDDVSRWKAMPSDGVSLAIVPDDGAMRLDFDFHHSGGYAIARLPLDLALPENYEVDFRIRANAPVENLELKLVDQTGDDVWWDNRQNFVFPRDWKTLRTKKRQLAFAWGPVGGGDIHHVSALEIVVTAGSGGKGSVWIDDLALVPREPEGTPYPRPIVHASSNDAGAAQLLETPNAPWRSVNNEPQSLTIDFGRPRELGGLRIDWDDPAFASAYDVALSDDGKEWERVWQVAHGNGNRDYIPMEDAEARFVRIKLEAAKNGAAIRHLKLEPAEASLSRNEFFTRIAHDATRGDYPRFFTGEQSFWTLFGVAGDANKALINSDGRIEIDPARFSIEPFLFLDDKLVTWNDVVASQSLDDGYLPIPSVAWIAPHNLRLIVTAFASGAPGASVVHARYRLENAGGTLRKATLFLAIRPFQVNAPWQFLGRVGGTTEIHEIARSDNAVHVDTSTIESAKPPTAFGAAAFADGDIIDWLRLGTLPSTSATTDDYRAASAALRYDLTIPAHGEENIDLAVDLASPLHASPHENDADAATFDPDLRRTRAMWHERLDRVTIDLPPSAGALIPAMRANLAYILINADGAALRPGSRAYARSWIRDGAMIAAALLRLGEIDAVRDYIHWFVDYQYPNGKVPCCVDTRGSDPVPENDSDGELLYLIAEYERFTHDRVLLQQVWPHVVSAVAHIDAMRQQRMTAEYRTEKQAYFGLVPESISHEGYSAKPMHSYWDDFWTLQGLVDATELATMMNDAEKTASYAAMRDELRKSITSSITLSMASHHIDYIPGSVELGDFDATSTTIAVAPADDVAALPRAALQRTFDKYWDNFVARRDGKLTWENYTPYEFRVAGTFIRLGQRQRAHELFRFFFHDRRPEPWNAWAEVVWHDPKTPKFIGDLPHSWVGSDYIRSFLDVLAYERASDQSLVLAAGVMPSWLEKGVRVENLRTRYGMISYTLKSEESRTHVHVSGTLTMPPGGIMLELPARLPTHIDKLPFDMLLR